MMMMTLHVGGERLDCLLFIITLNETRTGSLFLLLLCFMFYQNCWIVFFM